MRIRFSFLLVVLVLVLSVQKTQAQGWSGLNGSNYAGVSAVYQNPSLIADSRYKFNISLVGADINFYNTYLELDLPYTPLQAIRGTVPAQFLDDNGNPRVEERYLVENVNGKPKFVNLSAEVRLPSFMISLSNKHSVAFSNRVRAIVQGNNISENIARLARYGLGRADSLGLTDKLLSDNRFAVNANSYHEFAFTYARALTENTRHYVKAGITAKYLVGLGGAFLNNQGLGYVVYNSDSLQIRDRDASYGYTDYQYYSRDDFKVSDLYNRNRLGRGIGADLGVTYEFRPDYEKYNYFMDNRDWVDNSENKYKVRLGFSLMDIGSVKYKQNKYVRNIVLSESQTVQWGSLDTLNFNNLQHVDSLAEAILGIRSKTNQFSAKLPATMQLTADYRASEHLYVNATWSQSMVSRYAVGTRTLSNLTFTPRIEYKLATFSVPFILANDYQKLQIGGMLKLGPLIIGSDNVGALFGTTNITGYDLYFSLNFGLNKKRHKDKDNDKVSNKKDKCDGVPGTWETRGCPDKDNDGVYDKADKCPDVVGSAEAEGCPDADKDGVPDTEDKCPTLAGPRRHLGCPDTDGDGVYDEEDACADKAGPSANKGCPYADTDGDGVADNEDECPNKPGVATNKGCPELKKEEAAVLEAAFSNLNFEASKAIIKSTSYASLDELAKLLVEKNYRIKLSGHTDNQGPREANLILSEERVNQVRDYLMSKGVKKTQIQTEWFGPDKPKVSNSTPAGRSVNRRVEMRLLQD